MKNFDKKKFVKLALGYAAMLIITGTLAAIAFVVGDKMDQDRIKKDAENKVAQPAAQPAKPWISEYATGYVPLVSETSTIRANTSFNNAAEETIDKECHRVAGNVQAKPCLEMLRTEILKESGKVWKDILGGSNFNENDHWISDPLNKQKANKEDWERLCLTGLEKNYGLRDEPSLYLRTPSWCLSTVEKAAQQHNIKYNSKHMEYLHRKISAVSRWELR